MAKTANNFYPSQWLVSFSNDINININIEHCGTLFLTAAGPGVGNITPSSKSHVRVEMNPGRNNVFPRWRLETSARVLKG